MIIFIPTLFLLLFATELWVKQVSFIGGGNWSA
jgi:hypothetical protein